LASGLTALKISTCICDEKTFEKLYKVDGYKTVQRNIHLICERNNQLNKKVNIHLSMRVPKPFSKITDNTDFKSIKQYFKDDEIHFFDELYDSWGGRIKESDLPSGYGICQNKFDMTKEPCYELFRKINVLYNGEVNFCSCRDLNADLKIGNIKDDSLLDIWHSRELSSIRNNWFMGNVPDICFECQRYLPLSSFYKKFQKDIVKRYLKSRLRFI
jgi:radical SAM protein with 4Fe4S-binding SPASM domain